MNPTPELENEPTNELNKELEQRKQAILAYLTLQDIGIVAIHYSGSDDSGTVNDVCGYKSAEKLNTSEDVNLKTLPELSAERLVPLLTAQRLQGTEALGAIHEALEYFAYNVLEEVNATSWCDNDGGDGTIYVFVKAGSVEGENFAAGQIYIDHGYNVSERHNERYVV